MLARILQSRGLARAALGGLATGFAVLAALAWVGASAIENAVDEVHTAAEVSSTWDRVLVLVINENEAINDHLRAPDERGIDPLASSVGSAAPSLAWLAQHSRPEMATQTTLIAGSYDVFTDNIKSMVKTGRGSDRTELLEQADEAALSSASLRKQLTVVIQLEHVHLNGILKQIKQTHQRLRTAMYVVIGIDVALLLMCANMLLAYQRRIEVHAERSHHRSQHDPLTGLPNRVVFEERLTDLIAAASGERPVPFAVFMLDLDGFKGINDTLGHHHGDLLLVSVAERLSGEMRSGDTVVRLGGDEFAILAQVSGRDQVVGLAGRVQAAICVPTVLDDETVRVGVSIGVALAPDHSTDARELLRFADAAMYTAKRNKLGVTVHSDAPPAGAASDYTPEEIAAG